MSWIYRAADQHKCDVPATRGPGGITLVSAGDLWKCTGNSGCGAVWMAMFDQRDGNYMAKLSADEAAAQLEKRGLA